MANHALQAQLHWTLRETHLTHLGERYLGKVRDVYRTGKVLVLVTTDRLSAFDRVLTTVPFKGEVLNRLAQFWFERTQHLVPNHLIEVPDPNVMIARPCQPFAVEVVVRGYLTGSLWRDYQKGEAPYGLKLPGGMRKDERFPTPVLTPSTKAPKGEHDAPIAEREVVRSGLASEKDWGQIREYALALFRYGQQWASEHGLILVDTKYEFGVLDGKIHVIDEMHTPDSSRFWSASEYEKRFAAGHEQKMLDKENIRQWLLKERGFAGDGEPPNIPDLVRMDLAQKYLDAYAAITGTTLALKPGPVEPRIRSALTHFKP